MRDDRTHSAIAGFSGLYDLVVGALLLCASAWLASAFGVTPAQPQIFSDLNGIFLLAVGAGYYLLRARTEQARDFWPMAALLGLLTGLLAFLPNIGAIVSGVLMVAVGFSAGNAQGLWAIFVYFFVQNVDGYLVVPYIARRTVKLAPAVVLAAQLIFGALFGILGLLLADPIIASAKVALEEFSKRKADKV